MVSVNFVGGVNLPPRFLTPEFAGFSVSEAAPADVVVGVVYVIDDDEGDEVALEIEAGNEDGMFQIQNELVRILAC